MGEIQLCVAQGRGLASVHIKLPTWTVGYFIKLMKSTAVLVGCTKQIRTGLTRKKHIHKWNAIVLPVVLGIKTRSFRSLCHPSPEMQLQKLKWIFYSHLTCSNLTFTSFEQDKILSFLLFLVERTFSPQAFSRGLPSSSFIKLLLASGNCLFMVYSTVYSNKYTLWTDQTRC